MCFQLRDGAVAIGEEGTTSIGEEGSVPLGELGGRASFSLVSIGGGRLRFLFEMNNFLAVVEVEGEVAVEVEVEVEVAVEVEVEIGIGVEMEVAADGAMTVWRRTMSTQLWIPWKSISP